MKQQDSEDEDNNNTFHHKTPSICDSPSNLSISRRISRSRSRSRSRDGSRSRSVSTELEVDSPPSSPLPSRLLESPIITEITPIPKKSETFSVSALLKQDPKKSNDINRNELAYNFTNHPQMYDPNMLARPFFHPFFAAVALHGQHQNIPMNRLVDFFFTFFLKKINFKLFF